MCFLGPTQTQTTIKLIGSAAFAQPPAESPYIYNGLPFYPKLPLPMGIWTPSNTWFPVPTRDISPNGISIGAAVFVWFYSVTDRQTDVQTTLLSR